MITAGSISFILYFVTENLDALDYWSATTTYVLVVVVFITSPVPGNVAGGWWVQNKCGGYMNYGITLYSSFVSMAISAVGIFALPIFVWVGNKVSPRAVGNTGLIYTGGGRTVVPHRHCTISTITP